MDSFLRGAMHGDRVRVSVGLRLYEANYRNLTGMAGSHLSDGELLEGKDWLLCSYCTVTSTVSFS